MHRDRFVGIIGVLLGAAIAYMTYRLPDSTMAGDIGPKVFPFVSAALLLVCGAILLIRKPSAHKAWLQGKQQWLRFLAIILVILAYVVLLVLFGYIFATLVFVTALFMMFGQSEGAKLWQGLTYAGIVTLSTYLLFNKVLSLRMPVGSIFTIRF